MNKYFLLIFLFVALSCHKKTIATVIEPPFTGVVYLDSFGAKGDGRTDDINAFERSISFLTNKGGGVLKLTKGKTYRVTKTIKVSCSNFTLDLNGGIIDGRDVQLSQVMYVPVLAFLGSNKQSINTSGRGKVNNFNGLREVEPGEYVKISSEENLQIARSYYYKSEFVKVKNTEGNKVYTEESLLEYTKEFNVETYNFIRNVLVTNGTIICNKTDKSGGISFEKSLDCQVKNVFIKDATIYGLQFDNSVNAMVDSVKMISKTSPNYGLNYGVLFSRSQNCDIKNSYCEVLRTGIDQSLSHFITIENNKTVNCGISPHAGTNIVIKNNIIERGNIYMRSYQSKIIGNQITVNGCEAGGIVLAELNGKSNIEIEGNIINFVENANCDNFNSDFIGVGIYSGEVNLTDITIRNNKIFNAHKGIYVFRADNNSGNKNLTITDNEIVNCKIAGIVTHRYSNQEILRNTISGDGKNTIGIYLWESGGRFDNVLIGENTISNVKVGLSATKNYRDKVIRNNIIKNAKTNENVQH